jgi:23S rRNA pseudouridine955/2504/2580 synthase
VVHKSLRIRRKTKLAGQDHPSGGVAVWYDLGISGSRINELMNHSQPIRPAARLVEVDAEHAGQRIDNFLSTQLKGVPRTLIYRVLRKGEVRVNSGRVRPDYRVQSGDRIRIPPVRTGAVAAGAQAGAGALELLAGRILYEDPGLLIIDKPAGMAVHGGSGVSYGVIEALRALRPEVASLELVHRLDRETSGCLMVAKRRSVLRALHEQLRSGEVKKRYLLLVAGRWQGGRRTVSEPLLKNVLQSGERMVQVSESGKHALTVFRAVSVYRTASLVEADLGTGRTHQIRVHAAHLAHPIAGDEKYGAPEFNRKMKRLGLRRLFLHAHALSFRLPGTERDLDVSAPLGDDLRSVLDALESENG